ncbi:hypothetical protein JD969_07050 [Planctomycetota bacterium]|nr:hypothetical protein JD969_07050 [Planctomycetota bacterium]
MAADLTYLKKIEANVMRIMISFVVLAAAHLVRDVLLLCFRGRALGIALDPAMTGFLGVICLSAFLYLTYAKHELIKKSVFRPSVRFVLSAIKCWFLVYFGTALLLTTVVYLSPIAVLPLVVMVYFVLLFLSKFDLGRISNVIAINAHIAIGFLVLSVVFIVIAIYQKNEFLLGVGAFGFCVLPLYMLFLLNLFRLNLARLIKKRAAV